MAKSQRTKGAVGEREVRDLFAAAYGTEFHRNIGQARDGGNDLDIGPLCVEVKRRKTLGTVYSWLKQAIDAVPAFVARTGEAQPVPLVVAREDGGQWLAVLRLSDFLALTRDEIGATLAEQPAPTEPPAPPCSATFITAAGETVRCQAGREDHTPHGGHVGFITSGGKTYRYMWG